MLIYYKICGVLTIKMYVELFGFPGAGKTTLCKKLSLEFGGVCRPSLNEITCKITRSFNTGGLSDIKNDVVTGLIYLPFHNGTSYNQ